MVATDLTQNLQLNHCKNTFNKHMVLIEKQIKIVQDIIKKIKRFTRKMGYKSKNWLKDLESETLFISCINLRKACMFEALDSAGRIWWNAIPDIHNF